jgi:hypothetical protein
MVELLLLCSRIYYCNNAEESGAGNFRGTNGEINNWPPVVVLNQSEMLGGLFCS